MLYLDPSALQIPFSSTQWWSGNNTTWPQQTMHVNQTWATQKLSALHRWACGAWITLQLQCTLICADRMCLCLQFLAVQQSQQTQAHLLWTLSHLHGAIQSLVKQLVTGRRSCLYKQPIHEKPMKVLSVVCLFVIQLHFRNPMPLICQYRNYSTIQMNQWL